MKTRNREVNVFSMSALDLFASALGAFILISIVLMPYFLHVSPEEVADLRRELRQERSTSADLRRRLEEAQSELQQCRQQEAACQEDLAALQQEVARLQDALDQAQAGLAEAREDLRQAESELQQCQAELNVCEEKLSRTFLAIVIQWPTEIHDVDLHVIDPAGERFYYQNKTIPGRPGELSADTTIGPGVEIWEVAVAPAGKYEVRYNFYSNEHGGRVNEEPAEVKGGVYHRDGYHPLAEQTLTTIGGSDNNKAKLVAIVTVNDDGSVEISHR